MSTNNIYIAGPMTGLPNFNFEAFFDAEEIWSNKGWVVYNPARHDVECGIDARELSLEEVNSKFNLEEAALWDLQSIVKCQAIYMLAGWNKSKGARAEHAVAEWLGKEIHYQ